MKWDAFVFGVGTALFTVSTISYPKIYEPIAIGLLALVMVGGAAASFYAVMKNLKR